MGDRIFYHRTTRAAADAILRHGFKDRVGYYLMTKRFRGVFVSDVPLDVNEGAKGDVLLEVRVPASAVDASFRRYLDRREVIEEGKPYREWILSARVIKERARLREVGFDEECELTELRFPSALRRAGHDPSEHMAE